MYRKVPSLLLLSYQPLQSVPLTTISRHASACIGRACTSALLSAFENGEARISLNMITSWGFLPIAKLQMLVFELQLEAVYSVQ